MDAQARRLLLCYAFADASTSLGQRIRAQGGFDACWQTSSQWICHEPPERQRLIAEIKNKPAEMLVKLDFAGCDDWQVIALGDAAYPALLAQLDNAPGILFVRGDAEVLSRPQLAMVGSRHASAEGITNAKQLASRLAAKGFAVTSGLAVGIDAAAHQGAISQGTSIAVMGTGPDAIYPRRHQALAQQIVASGGALVTEFPPGEKAKPYHFPMRNRVISGLSLGVIVVEAAIKSGSLITAKLAMNQGREVFALPGSVRNPLSRGCNQLLRDGANWLETLDDVTKVFASMRVLAQSTEEEMLDQEGTIPELLEFFISGINSLDQLQLRSGRLLTDLMDELMDLELEGWVEKATGGYQRSR